MSARVRLPGVPMWRLAAVVAAGVAGWWALGAQEATLPRLDSEAMELLGEPVSFPRSRAVETKWIDSVLPAGTAFALELALAPSVGPPCPGNLDRVPHNIERLAGLAQRKGTARALSAAVREANGHWLPTLSYASFLLQQGQTTDAERELQLLTQTAPFVQLMRNLKSRDVEEYLAEIHVLHSLSYSRLRNRSHQGEDVLGDLRRAIRRADYLGKLGKTDLPQGAPNWYNHQLRRPGCSWRDGDLLSTFDLYNNLLQLYLVSNYREKDPEVRDREFHRDYQDPAERNPMLRVFRQAQKTRMGSNQAWVWAASNVERLARDRRENGLGPPDHARLALSMARVMAEGDSLLPPHSEARKALWREIEANAAVTEQSRQGSIFVPALVRLELLSQVAGFPFKTGLTLPEAQGLRLAVQRAVAVRSDPELRGKVLQGQSIDLEALGSVDGLDAWRTSLRLDSATDLAKAGLTLETGADPVNLVQLTDHLVGDDAPPAEVVELRDSLSWGDRFRLLLRGPVAHWIFACLAGLATFVFSWWLGLQALMHKHLFTSFYRLEAEARLRGHR